MGKQGIVQVCVVVNDLQKAMEKYWETLHIGPWKVYTLSPEILDELTYYGEVVKEPYKFFMAVAMVGNVQFELIQPVEGPLIYTKFLEEKGETYHHVKILVDDKDIEKTLKMYKDKGIDVIQSGRFDNDAFYYLDTEPILGITVEIGICGKVRPPERWYPESFNKDKSSTM